MTDAEKLDVITGSFIKTLIAHKFNDENTYFELGKRLEILINLEMKWRLHYEEQRTTMSAWGPDLN